MGTSISITFINGSVDSFSLDQNGSYLEPGLSHLEQTPDATLAAAGGRQVIAAELNHSNIQVMDQDIWCCWNNGLAAGSGGWRFGIKIHQSAQELGIGYSPVFYFMSDENPNSSTIDWQNPGSNTAPFTFPVDTSDSSDPINNFCITATPDSQHSSLSVSVSISNRPSSGS